MVLVASLKPRQDLIPAINGATVVLTVSPQGELHSYYQHYYALYTAWARTTMAWTRDNTVSCYFFTS